MSEFKCYQAAETTNVVLGDADLSMPAEAPPAVVIISREVGNPRARALMRLCAAVLNGDELEAQRELDAIHGESPCARETAEQQIERLADFILAEVPGEPSQSQGAVDTAIRLLRTQVEAKAPVS